ncbi:glutamate ABC transporter substrate-binding protein [Gordonia sinesedis]
MTARRRGRAVRWLIAATVGSMTLTGCVNFPAPEAPAPIATAVLPIPPGAETDVPTEPAPNLAACDATSTLRPDNPMPPPRQMPPRSTMDTIFRRGRLIVGLDIGSNPFSFRDPISGDIQGFDVDIAREIAGAIFGDPNRIEYRVLSSAERISALQNDTVDAVVKTMSITCERRRNVNFSAPYYVASQKILVSRNSGITDVGGLVGKRVCSARGTTSIGRMQAVQPRAKMVSTTTWADCLVMLQQGQVDAVSTDDAILAGLAAQDPWAVVVGPSMGEEYYGVGLPQGRDDMVRFVNGVLQTIRANGRWQQIYNQWLSILGPNYGPPQPIYRD